MVAQGTVPVKSCGLVVWKEALTHVKCEPCGETVVTPQEVNSETHT